MTDPATMAPGGTRVVGIDLGERRIGVAVGDRRIGLATAHATVERSDRRGHDHAALARIVAEAGAHMVVVGHPISLDAHRRDAAQRAEREAEELARVLEVPVVLQDERFTTTEARGVLQRSGVRGRDQRRVIDQVAAALLLQAWMDSHPPDPPTQPPDPPTQEVPG